MGPSGQASLGRIVVVEDDALMLRAVGRSLSAAGFVLALCGSADAAWDALSKTDVATDVLLTDVLMPGRNGFELLSGARSQWPDLAIVLMTGQATVAAAVEAMRLGAYDYLVKPADPETTLIPSMRRAVAHARLLKRNRFLEGQLQASRRAEGLVGDSLAMRHVSSLVSAAASTDITVLVLGESGTGKELVARAIHQQSPRKDRTFVDVNCAALTDSLLESELFGHVKGAFTGATTARRGLFETASGGTLFLDEVGELSPATQARLLRVLQEGAVRPVGSSESKQVDVRIVAATNRDLALEVAEGRFRRDLFYRLNVLIVDVPPLRERQDDIAPLLAHFLDIHSRKLGRGRPHVAPDVLESLLAYDWPGNVRELENTVARALVLCPGEVISSALLPHEVRAKHKSHAEPVHARLLPLNEARDAFVRTYVQRALAETAGNISEAARLADIDPSNFRRLLKRLGDGSPSSEKTPGVALATSRPAPERAGGDDR